MAWRPVPILPMSDARATAELYARLGFTVVDATPAGQQPYLVAERHGAELHFFHWPDVDPLSSGFRCYLEVDDVDGLHAEWSAVVGSDGLPRLSAPAQQPWGLREMGLVDLDGTLLRVATRPR
jgi:catechol 2,3-dioxygenase-like lactoylglutathione lyase family enzyme